MAGVKKCNLCGKQFDLWDIQEDFCIHKRLGFGTKYDGDVLHMYICCDCMDAIIDRCELSPIAPEELEVWD